MADTAQFLYRTVKVTADGALESGWQVLAGEQRDLLVGFDSVQAEYCVEVEALRAADGEIMSLGEQCIAHTLGELGPRPRALFMCDAEPSGEAYRTAWCADNADACAEPSTEDAAACAGYDQLCADGETEPVDAGSSDDEVAVALDDAGVAAGDAAQASASSARADSQPEIMPGSGRGICSVAMPGSQRRTDGAIWLALIALSTAVLGRRVRGRA